MLEIAIANPVFGGSEWKRYFYTGGRNVVLVEK